MTDEVLSERRRMAIELIDHCYDKGNNARSLVEFPGMADEARARCLAAMIVSEAVACLFMSDGRVACTMKLKTHLQKKAAEIQKTIQEREEALRKGS